MPPAVPQTNEEIITSLRILVRNTVHILNSEFWILDSDGKALQFFKVNIGGFINETMERLG